MAMQIPIPVLDDLCMRFVDNIPDSEKNDPIRVCFQIEQAHWFYVDFYCEKKRYPNCPSLNFQHFTKQLINRSEALSKYRNHVEKIIDQFRSYKAFIPTYGAIMFDKSLTKVLLVQGYFASKNSWGFPKVNEMEDPKVCAIREVLEETGYDISQNLVPDVCFNYALNDSLVYLYVATDVDRDFKFEPHLRKEIRKIAWFNVSDLPRHKGDFETCTLQGFRPNNFYGVLPAVDFIRKFSTEQIKLRQFSQKKKLSAFQPVIPKAQKQLPTLPTQGFSACALENFLLNDSLPSTSNLTPTTSNFMPYSSQPSVASPNSSHGSASSSNLFASFRLDNNTTPKSTRPQNLVASGVKPGYSNEGGNILKSLLKTPTAAQNPPTLYSSSTASATTSQQDIGVIGESSRKSSRNNLEIKHPIPIQSSSIIKPNSLGSLSFNPTPNSSFVNMANLSGASLQTQFGSISSDKSVTSDRDRDLSDESPREDEINFATPPLLLPSDLLACSPATPGTNIDAIANQAYLEACKLLSKSPYTPKSKRGKKTQKQKPEVELKVENEEFDEPGPSTSKLSPAMAKSPDSSNVSEILSNMFSAARNTGGVIKATENKELKPIFHAEIEENISENKTTTATSETTIDKYALSGTNSVASDPKIYETVYYNDQQSDTNSEEILERERIFDIASNNEEDVESEKEVADEINTPTMLHNGNNGLRIGALELCNAWKSFKLDLTNTTLSSLFN